MLVVEKIKNIKQFLFGTSLRTNFTVFGIILILALVAFSSVMNGGFLYDDRVFIVENYYIRSLANIPQFFISSAARGANVVDTNLYRPLMNTIHTLLFAVFELKTYAYHFTNVALHVVNACLIFVFLKRLGFWKVACALLAMIFVIHPIQAESVGYIAGLPDILSTTFMLIGFNIFLKFGAEDEDISKRRRRFIWICVLLVLGFLTKELPVVFMPLMACLAIYKWREYDGKTKGFVKKLLYVLAGITGLYLVMKFTVLNFVGGSLSLNTSGDYGEHMWVRAFTFLRMIWEYLRLLFWPVHLFFEKQNFAYTFLGGVGFFGLGVVVFGAAGALLSYFRKRVFMLSYLWFFIALAPVSGILIPANFMYADHWLYVPIIGFLVLIAAMASELRKKWSKGAFIAICLIIMTLFTYRLYERNKEWADPVLFFENEVQYYPSVRTYTHLGFEYMQRLKVYQAVEYFEKAIEVDDVYPHPHFHLASLKHGGGNVEGALDEFYKALEIAPNHVASLSSVGIIADSMGRADLVERIEVLLARISKNDLITFDEIPGRGEF